MKPIAVGVATSIVGTACEQGPLTPIEGAAVDGDDAAADGLPRREIPSLTCSVSLTRAGTSTTAEGGLLRPARIARSGSPPKVLSSPSWPCRRHRAARDGVGDGEGLIANGR
jgi:hypothetical protein